jgi:hypothetical protein
MAAQAIIREDGDSLVDGIFFGEGEGAVGELARRVGESASQPISKKESLERAVEEVPGLWVAGSQRTIVKAVCEPHARFLPVEYPILNTPEAHAANLQINYGCPSFCSFCFEGYDRKPYREVALADVLAVAWQIKRGQGVEELNLYSFNFNTHQDILEMILELHWLFERVSLKSQRVDILCRVPGLLEAEVEADKRNFTLGIEGISDRLRAWLHKSLPREDIIDLMQHLFALRVRRIKLFYVLTGYEADDDIEEFRQFLRWLKEVRRRSQNRSVRVIFSFGLLVRMPFTPLRYDRLLLDEQTWRPLMGKVKSACETNGFEFRLAFDWPTYCVTQVLAIGGHWLVEPLAALAQEGYYFDTTLEPAYWDELKRWLVEAGHWDEAFLSEKSPDYPFALGFVRSNVSAEFLYRQYQEIQAGHDRGYCLGDLEQPGRCLGCGACVGEEQRQAITHHQIRQPDRVRFAAQLREVMDRKRRLQPVYSLVRLDSWLAGLVPESLNGFVFKAVLTSCPDLVDNLLSVRESLFAVRPNDRRFPAMSGETVFALKAWDVDELEQALETRVFGKDLASGVEILGLVPGYTPGEFARLHLEVHLPADLFPEPRARLEQYLRSAYLRYSLRREGVRYRFDLPPKALKKKILFGGSFETREGDQGFLASLDVGPKFDLMAFLGAFGGQGLAHRAQVRVSDIEW